MKMIKITTGNQISVHDFPDCVKIGRRPVPGQEDKKNGQMEYTVEYWEE